MAQSKNRGPRGRPVRRRQAAPQATHAWTPRSKQADAFARGERVRKVVFVVAVLAVVGMIAFFPIALYTDQPSYCPSCHTMRPFYDAWQTGGHKNLWCIDCHVDAGYPNRFMHKFAALREVYDQVFKHATFPSYDAGIPNARCLRCHEDVPTSIAAVGQFSHRLHLARGVQCATCHATVGHRVTFAALNSAGVLNSSQVSAGNTFVGQQFQGLASKHSALPGHKPVPCSNCHDQANLQCSFCHTAPPNHFGADCRLCHRPDVPFPRFMHPPSEHSYLSRPCATCHPDGYMTVFCTCHNGHPPRGD